MWETPPLVSRTFRSPSSFSDHPGVEGTRGRPLVPAGKPEALRGEGAEPRTWGYPKAWCLAPTIASDPVPKSA